MTKQEAKKRIEKLREEINHHRYQYHVLDKLDISDAAFDSLKNELEDALGTAVDLVEYDAIKPILRPYIMQHLVPLL